MSKNFAIIGGDQRIVELAKMLVEDGNVVYIYGLEKAENLENCNNLTSLEELSNKDIEIVIGPIPFSKDGKNIFTKFSEEEISIKSLLKASKRKNANGRKHKKGMARK